MSSLLRVSGVDCRSLTSLNLRGVLQTGHLLPARDLAHSMWQSALQQTSRFFLVYIFNGRLYLQQVRLSYTQHTVAFEAVDGKQCKLEHPCNMWDVSLSCRRVFLSKSDCVGHMQKRLGTALWKLKKPWGKKKLQAQAPSRRYPIGLEWSCTRYRLLTYQASDFVGDLAIGAVGTVVSSYWTTNLPNGIRVPQFAYWHIKLGCT